LKPLKYDSLASDFLVGQVKQLPFSLADRTNGSSYAKQLSEGANRSQISRKRLRQKLGFKWPPIGNDLWRIKWSRNRWRHLTLKGHEWP